MTVHEMTGDMWGIDADIYVVPTNARGVMGAGLALRFAEMFPETANRYWQECTTKDVGPGDTWVAQLGPNPFGNPAHVVCMATKDDWREPSEMRWITVGLASLFVIASMNFVAPRGLVALPAIGCGLGGLPWPEVRSLVHDVFDPQPGIQIGLFSPQ